MDSRANGLFCSTDEWVYCNRSLELTCLIMFDSTNGDYSPFPYEYDSLTKWNKLTSAAIDDVFYRLLKERVIISLRY